MSNVVISVASSMSVVVVQVASVIIILVVGCGAVFLALLVHRTAQEVVHAYRTPLRSLRGPKSNSVLFGSFKDVLEYEAYRTQERWIQCYGPIFKFQSFLNVCVACCLIWLFWLFYFSVSPSATTSCLWMRRLCIMFCRDTRRRRL